MVDAMGAVKEKRRDFLLNMQRAVSLEMRFSHRPHGAFPLCVFAV